MAASAVRIPARALTHRLGFNPGLGVPRRFADLLEDNERRVREAARPRAVWRNLFLDADAWDGGLLRRLDERGRRRLGRCEVLSVFLLTLGAGVDELIRERQYSGDTLGAFLCDGIAAELAEYAVREIDRRLRFRAAGERYSGSRRSSPGYPGFPLELNRELVEVLDGGELGVICDGSSYGFLPRKTVAGLIAWRRN